MGLKLDIIRSSSTNFLSSFPDIAGRREKKREKAEKVIALCSGV